MIIIILTLIMRGTQYANLTMKNLDPNCEMVLINLATCSYMQSNVIIILSIYISNITTATF